MNIRAALIAFVPAALIAAPAIGADLGGSIKDAPRYVPVVSTWSGFYAGLNAGYGFAGHDRVGLDANTLQFWTDGTLHIDGFFGGGQIGYNHQSGNIVLGVEADIQGSAIKDSIGPAASVPAGGPLVSATSDVNWFATLRGRLGVVSGPFLFYATGGVAFAGIDYTVATTGPVSLMRNDETMVGWTAGGGVEYALDNRWSAKVEYMYVDFGKTAVTGPVANAPIVTFTTQETPDFHLIRVGLNYKLW